MKAVKRESDVFGFNELAKAQSSHRNPSGQGQQRAVLFNKNASNPKPIMLDEQQLKARKTQLEANGVKPDITNKALQRLQHQKSANVTM